MSAPAPAPAEQDMPNLLSEMVEPGIARLTLNRPRARNALSRALMAELQAELERIGRDRAIHVVILAANGPAFCAGHDLREMRADPSRETHAALFQQCSRLMTGIVQLPQPVIAEVQGPAFAAGCQLAATCDLAIAAANATFSTPGVNIGLFCSTPMVALSRAVGRKKAMRMLLTGEALDADGAASAGLINEAVPADRLGHAVLSLARTIAAKSRPVVAIGKEAFYHQVEMGLEEAYAYTAEVMAENMQHPDAAEGIDAFIAKREPHWQAD